MARYVWLHVFYQKEKKLGKRKNIKTICVMTDKSKSYDNFRIHKELFSSLYLIFSDLISKGL